MMVVAIALSVGRNVDELRPLSSVGESAHQPVGEPLSVIEQSFKRHTLRDRTIVKEQVYFLFRGQVRAISPSRINFCTTYLFVLGAVLRSKTLGLSRRKNRELNPVFSQYLEGLFFSRGFRKPHPFWAASEPAFKICNPPLDLGYLIPPIRQRQNHMVVALRNRGPVPGKLFAAAPVGIEDRLIDPGSLLLHPRQYCGPEVKAHFCVVVEHFENAILGVENSRGCVGSVAFGCYAFVPVVVGIGGILQFNCLEIRILAWRLIKMSVDANVFHICSVRACFCSITMKE